MLLSDVDLVLMRRQLSIGIEDLERREARLYRRVDRTDLQTWERRIAETQAEAAALRDLRVRVDHDLMMRNVLDKLWKEVYNLDEK